MAAKAGRDLDELIREKYNNAWKFEKARSYRNAKAAFEQIMGILPMADLEREGQIKKVIIPNVIDHLRYIKSKLGKVRER